MTRRRRLDKALVERDLARSRGQAKRLIDDRKILVNGFPADKPSTLVEHDDHLTVTGDDPDWVGRGARKIWPLLEAGRIDPEGRVCLDVGSSTGGFTQALLRAGASKVHAVDVGYGQLVTSLRRDDRVRVRERTNFRHADADDFQPTPTVVTMDVSFISVVKLLPALNRVMDEDSSGLILIKPQFEAGPDENVDGIVKDFSVIRRVLLERIDDLAEAGWGVTEVDLSPVPGSEGNREFFFTLQRATEPRVGPSRVDRALESAEEPVDA